MKKSLFLVLILLFSLSMSVHAIELSFNTSLNVTYGSGIVNIITESQNYTNINCTSNSSINDRIIIRRNVSTNESVNSEILRLAQESANTTKSISQSWNNVGSFINTTYRECVDGRAAIAGNNQMFKDERDKYQNQSDNFEGLYNNQSADKKDAIANLNDCNSKLGNAERNISITDQTTKNGNSKLPFVWIAVGLAGGYALGQNTKKGGSQPVEMESKYGYGK